MPAKMKLNLFGDIMSIVSSSSTSFLERITTASSVSWGRNKSRMYIYSLLKKNNTKKSLLFKYFAIK